MYDGQDKGRIAQSFCIFFMLLMTYNIEITLCKVSFKVYFGETNGEGNHYSKECSLLTIYKCIEGLKWFVRRYFVKYRGIVTNGFERIKSHKITCCNGIIEVIIELSKTNGG